MPDPHTILFAGGGSGGHIFPNAAVWESLKTQDAPIDARFLVSERPLDAEVCEGLGVRHHAISAAPLSVRPGELWRWWRGYRRAIAQTRSLILEANACAVVATGGFVSGPAVAAASKAGLPVALVNLDAVPGKANRFAARYATDLFSVYPVHAWPDAKSIGLPIRPQATPGVEAGEARRMLGLNPDRPVLLITAGSQGLGSINQMMTQWVSRDTGRAALDGWQVLHLSGARDRDATEAGYRSHGTDAKVLAFCDRMGLAWCAAELAISLAGAGSVAEAWANAVPSVLLPYPYHRDQHQRLNAQPMIEAGGAILLEDRIDPVQNADQLDAALPRLLTGPSERERMRAALTDRRPPDGAAAIADWTLSELDLR